MKITLNINRETASTLVIVMILGAVSLLMLASTMSWTSGTARVVDSSNHYSEALAAAEAATEKVISQISTDFSGQGAATVSSKLSVYKQIIPNNSESAHWAKYQFSNGSGVNDAVSVTALSPWATGVPLISQYQGLSGYAATFRIKADATDLTAQHVTTGAIQQDLQLALIPIFQFAIFYNMDLEINPGAPMKIGGRTHSNANIYLQPGATLTFGGDVTSSGNIIFGKAPGDPTSRSGVNPVFSGAEDNGVSSLNLPIGTNNTPAAVRQVVEIPPGTESVNSAMGQQRFYNNSDLVIVVNNPNPDGSDNVTVKSSSITNGSSSSLQWSSVSNFVNLNNSFYDAREKKTIKVTQVNVAGLVAWNATANNPLVTALHRDISSVYIADLRTQAASTEPGVRLINGATLPPLGLTVATPDPLYVQGDFNATGASVGSSNTANTKPAALVGDSINILSGAWNDADSAKAMGSNVGGTRVAAATTVNAAFLAGIVPTGNGYYSGGVENFPRFLENWSGTAFTYNGSMVVLFTSLFANAHWPGTGTVYNPPNRNWFFDTNFLDPTKLPPLCPSVRAVIRGQWASIAPGT